MSAFYLFGVIALWVMLTGALWKLWRLSRKGAGGKPGRIDVFFAIVAFTWLTASFWYGGGRKYYYDAEVDRLCAIDGGVKVYETVRLPAEGFDKYGSVRIPSKSSAKAEDEYFYEVDSPMIRAGDPEIWKLSFRVVRRIDGKTLGTATGYARRGGDLPGPWHPSSFGCPTQSDISNLNQQLFNR